VVDERVPRREGSHGPCQRRRSGSCRGPHERRSDSWCACQCLLRRVGEKRVSASIGQSDFPVPIDDRYFEDYIPDSVYEYGSITISRQEILEFARKYDPQPFHVDPEAASHGPFGGLIASGWHTASIMMRLFADHYLSRVASLGGPGVDELRWLKPVRPGDSLRIRVTVLEAKRSSSKTDRGLVRSLVEVFDQEGDPVMGLTVMNMLLAREDAPTAR
jgi:acyl dehydratase